MVTKQIAAESLSLVTEAFALRLSSMTMNDSNKHYAPLKALANSFPSNDLPRSSL